MDFKFKGGYSRMTGCTMGNHPEYDRGFRNGQQSKQAEIEALKAKLEEIENHAFMNYDYERDDDHHSYWSGYNVAMGEFVGIIKGDQE